VVYTVHGLLDVIKNRHCWRDRKMTGAPGLLYAEQKNGGQSLRI
jgi:hypothetical protein